MRNWILCNPKVLKGTLFTNRNITILIVMSNTFLVYIAMKHISFLKLNSMKTKRWWEHLVLMKENILREQHLIKSSRRSSSKNVSPKEKLNMQNERQNERQESKKEVSALDHLESLSEAEPHHINADQGPPKQNSPGCQKHEEVKASSQSKIHDDPKRLVAPESQKNARCQGVQWVAATLVLRGAVVLA